jgi:hypothetical protein
VVSTWDARASSVVLQYRRGFADGGGFNVVGYHANFSATSGQLSSQFGLYYMSFADGSDAPTAHGMAGSATAVFNLPVARRLDNGLPLTAIDFYVGSAPTALVSGERNHLTIPLVLGFGVPITPVKLISIVPWFEFSPSFNLDTIIHPYEFTPGSIEDYVVAGRISFDSSDVERIVSESVELETSAAIGARGGLDFALHVSDYFDFGLNATLSSVGSAFSGTRVVYLGAGFIWRWDEIVPAVLPAEKRLLHEACDDVEARFRSCPNSRTWKSPEELQGSSSPSSVAEPAPASEQLTAPPTPPPATAPAPSQTPAQDAPPSTTAPAPASPAPTLESSGSGTTPVTPSIPPPTGNTP